MPEPPKKPRGRVTNLRVTLTEQDRRRLQSWQRSTTITWGLAQRARIILLMAQGCSISDIARRLPISRRFVYKWVARYLVHGVDGLRDLPRPGPKGHPRRGDEPPTADHA